MFFFSVGFGAKFLGHFIPREKPKRINICIDKSKGGACVLNIKAITRCAEV